MAVNCAVSTRVFEQTLKFSCVQTLIRNVRIFKGPRAYLRIVISVGRHPSAIVVDDVLALNTKKRIEQDFASHSTWSVIIVSEIHGALRSFVSWDT